MQRPAHLSPIQRVTLASTLIPLLLPTLLGVVWPNIFTFSLPLTIAAIVFIVRGLCNRKISVAQWLVITAGLIVAVPAIAWGIYLFATGNRLF
jgi:hypothetical protein